MLQQLPPTLGRTYDEKLRTLLQGEAEVFVNFIMVDGEIATKHTIVFQLGNRFYRYTKGEFQLVEKVMPV